MTCKGDLKVPRTLTWDSVAGSSSLNAKGEYIDALFVFLSLTCVLQTDTLPNLTTTASSADRCRAIAHPTTRRHINIFSSSTNHLAVQYTIKTRHGTRSISWQNNYSCGPQHLIHTAGYGKAADTGHDEEAACGGQNGFAAPSLSFSNLMPISCRRVT